MKPETMLERLEKAKQIVEVLPCKADIISIEIRSLHTIPIRVHISKGIKSTATRLGAKMTILNYGDYTRMSVNDKYKQFEIIQLHSKRAAPGVTSTESGGAD